MERTRGPKLFIHLPVEAIVSHLIANLVDGGYWRVTPEGPEPVAPWTGPLAERAREAHRQIIEGLQALEDLAREVEGEVARASGVRPGGPVAVPSTPRSAGVKLGR